MILLVIGATSCFSFTAHVRSQAALYDGHTTDDPVSAKFVVYLVVYLLLNSASGFPISGWRITASAHQDSNPEPRHDRKMDLKGKSVVVGQIPPHAIHKLKCWGSIVDPLSAITRFSAPLSALSVQLVWKWCTKWHVPKPCILQGKQNTRQLFDMKCFATFLEPRCAKVQFEASHAAHLQPILDIAALSHACIPRQC
jgi:hypothetical protein